MINKYIVILSIVVSLPFTNAFADNTDEKKINYCIGVFSYSTNYFMLKNNEGAAKVMSFQLSRASVSFMSKGYVNGKVSGSYLGRFSSEKQKAKVYLDKNINKIGNEIDRCVLITNGFLKAQEAKGISMFGKSLQENIGNMNISIQKRLGLKR